MHTIEPSLRRAARRRHSRRPWSWKLALIAGGVVLLGAAGMLAAPPIGRLQIQVADGSDVAVGGSTSTVSVPKGWFIHSTQANTLRVDAPDRSLSLELTASAKLPDGALESIVSDLEQRLGSARTSGAQRELLASGTDLVHSDVGPRGLAAVVGDDQVVMVSATVSEGQSITGYGRAVAQILESVRP